MRPILPLLALLALPEAASAFRKMPYVQAVESTSAVVMWQADAPGPATVTVTGRDGFSIKVKLAAGATAGGGSRVGAAPITGLRPGQDYRFVVEQGGKRSTGRIRTPPPPGQPFTFAIYGDNRSGHADHAAVVAALVRADPDLVLNTGDLVGDGSDAAAWQRFFTISAPLARRTPIYPVIGNHDVSGGRYGLFRRFFHLPRDESYYAFTWGNVRFVAIDADVHIAGDGPDAAQTAWLLETIAAAEKDPAIDHTIAYVHQGPFSSNPRRIGNVGLRKLLPRLQAAGLDLIASGHDHYYERGLSSTGMPYMVVGGGGAPLYPSGGPGRYDGFTAFFSQPVHGFVRFRSAGAHLDGCAVDVDGTAFDCFDLTEAPGASK